MIFFSLTPLYDESVCFSAKLDEKRKGRNDVNDIKRRKKNQWNRFWNENFCSKDYKFNVKFTWLKNERKLWDNTNHTP